MLEIRIANINDLDNISQLYVDYINEKNSRIVIGYLEEIQVSDVIESYQEHIENGDVFVAYNHNEFLGFCLFRIYQNSIHIENILVLSNTLDIHLQLVSALGQYGYQNSYSTMKVWVEGGSNEVKDLYISHGAKENGFYGLKYTCY